MTLLNILHYDSKDCYAFSSGWAASARKKNKINVPITASWKIIVVCLIHNFSDIGIFKVIRASATGKNKGELKAI